MYCSYCAAVIVANQPVCGRCGRPVPVAISVRPPSVNLAVTLLLISCAISLLNFARVFLTYRRSIGIDARSIAPLILWIVFVIFLWRRQNWARFAILLLLAWSIGNLALVFLRVPAIWTFAVPIAVNALRLCAAYLMFRPDSNAWFKIH